MPVGEGFSAAQRTTIDAVVRRAETESRYEFSVFVGAAEQESRPFAERLHASLSAPARSVLVMVDPTARALEIVVGREAQRTLSHQSTVLAAAAMQSAFAGGDLVGGLTRGITMLGESARAPRVLHEHDEP